MAKSGISSDFLFYRALKAFFLLLGEQKDPRKLLLQLEEGASSAENCGVFYHVV